jgi:hypothetical protein
VTVEHGSYPMRIGHVVMKGQRKGDETIPYTGLNPSTLMKLWGCCIISLMA